MKGEVRNMLLTWARTINKSGRRTLAECNLNHASCEPSQSHPSIVSFVKLRYLVAHNSCIPEGTSAKAATTRERPQHPPKWSNNNRPPQQRPQQPSDRMASASGPLHWTNAVEKCARKPSGGDGITECSTIWRQACWWQAFSWQAI